MEKGVFTISFIALNTLIAVETALGEPSPAPTACSGHTDCTSCTGIFASSSDCSWCPQAGKCISQQEKCTQGDVDQSCTTSMYTIIFIVVVIFLTFLCCGACFISRYKRRGQTNLNEPLLSDQVRNILFRNSLSEQGEDEWMCVICGYDNKPRSSDCPMCGTSKKFTLDYKSEKKYLYKESLKRRKEQKKEENIFGSSSEASLKTYDKKIIAVSIKNTDASRNASSISAAARFEALNYRRLNTLSLRQKSARRRRMWQRVLNDETGEWTWARRGAKETIVGNSCLGYSPRMSLSSPSKFTISSLLGFPSSAQQDQSAPATPTNISASVVVGGNNLHIDRAALTPRDSFDQTLTSGSPGFTSVFSESGSLNWERVESGGYALRPDNIAATRPVLPDSYDIHMGDLCSAIALNFKEKQLWFLKKLSSLQRPWEDGCIRIMVDREHVFDQSVSQVNALKMEELHRFVRILFVGEPGIDAGGLEREWFALVADRLFDPKRGLFMSSAGGALSGSYNLNPLGASINPKFLEESYFAGRFLAKGIMQQHSIQAPLSVPLRKQILGLPITLSDLEFVDVELYRNLRWLMENDNVENLSLDFSVTYTFQDFSSTYELKPGGANISVTDFNKLDYLYLRLQHRMLDSIKPQLESFLRGFFEVLPSDLVSVFDYQELEMLMCGLPEIDLEDWKRHTEYLGEYFRTKAKHRVIKWYLICLVI